MTSDSLLAADEPGPVRVLSPGAASPVLLVCDHASNFVPRALGDLGLDHVALGRHVAWDIGAAQVTERLAQQLEATAILSNFSRLIVDPNRDPADPSSIPTVSDDVTIPANQALTPAAREARLATFFRPYQAALAAELAARRARGEVTALISIHSFTPVMAGFVRPWEIGILWNEDGRLALPMMEALRLQGVTVGDNEPYSGRDHHGYTTHTHADAAGLPNVLIEIRQDLIDTHKGAVQWADTLAPLLQACLAEEGMQRRWG